MTLPSISTAPEAPASTDVGSTFNTKAAAFVAWMADAPAEFNALAAALADVGAEALASAVDAAASEAAAGDFSAALATIAAGGNIYATHAAMTAAASGISSNGWALVLVDENESNHATVYQKQTGTMTLVFDLTVGAPPSWGDVTGTLADQTDLQAALDAKVAKAGVHEIPIPASGLTPRSTNGAAPGSSETATNKVMVETLDFDPGTAEYAQVRVPMPKRWNEGTVKAQFYWTTTGSSGSAVWAARAVAISDDDPMDAAFGSAQSVTDATTAANDLMISAQTGPITVGGSPASGDLVIFEFYRDATNVSDTLAADAKLVAVKLLITSDAGDDS